VGTAGLSAGTRPAFYALAPGGWRDYATLLHPPYTLWHLSYVAIGAGLTRDELPWQRLAALLVAFFLAMGIGAHALDELNGRPLQTRIGRGTLWLLAGGSIAAAVAIGIGATIVWTPWLAAFVASGAFIVVAYNLELFGGRFHGDRWFALAWGALPALTASFTVAESVTAAGVAAGAFAFLGSRAQRALSTEVRTLRRRSPELEPATREIRLRAPETALRALAWAHVALALSVLSLPLL
jgi:hypothetical protein